MDPFRQSRSSTPRVAQFDAQHPEGADYVIVPAMSRDNDSAVLAWLKNQAAKGAGVIGVCVGAKVVGEAGLPLTRGHVLAHGRCAADAQRHSHCRRSGHRELASGASASGDRGPQPARALDEALHDITARYGMRTADIVAMQLECPRPSAPQ